MKKTFVSLFSSIAFLAGTIFAATSPATPTPPKAAAQNAQKGERRERHPEIRQALMALQRAKHHLENAAHDFGGHRVEALKAVDEAIKQLRLALQYDKD